MKRSGFMRKRSPKTEARMRQVKPMYAARLADHPTCEVGGCWKPSTAPHHHTKLRRLGLGLFRFRMICGEHHHHFHHVSPAEAKAMGYLDCETEDDWGHPHGGRKIAGSGHKNTPGEISPETPPGD